MRLFLAVLLSLALAVTALPASMAVAQDQTQRPLEKGPASEPAEDPATPAWLQRTQDSLAEILAKQLVGDVPQADQDVEGANAPQDSHIQAEPDASASDADLPPIHRCDRLAGAPRDPYAVVRGVAFTAIDAAAAVPACEEAINAHPDALRFAFQLARALQAAERYEEAAQWYTAAADGGYPVAMNNLGTLYRFGRGVPQSDQDAFYWYSRAAHAKNPHGMANLGSLYRRGNGVPQDHAQAVRWYRQAADMGEPFAMRMLGQHYAYGLGVDTDAREAARWYRQAALAGDVAAMSDLAWFYSDGIGLPEDEGEAAHWYKTAGDLGSASAKRKLAWMILNGRGVPQDDEKAARLYLEAANAASPGAMAALAALYTEGRGVEKDPVAAAHWYRRSAEAGFGDGMAEFALLLDKGQGVEADPAAAADWAFQALRAGSYIAQARLQSGAGSEAFKDTLLKRLQAEGVVGDDVGDLATAINLIVQRQQR